MRKIFLMALCVTFSLVSVAQTRIVKGAVLDKNENPMAGVTVKLAESDQSVQTAANGTFEIEVSSSARRISALKEGYITSTLEIDGSYMVFKLKGDRETNKLETKTENEKEFELFHSKHGWYGQYVSLGYGFDMNSMAAHSIGFNYIGGCSINRNFFLGVGTGINVNAITVPYVENVIERGLNSSDEIFTQLSQVTNTKLYESLVSIPVFLHLRSDFAHRGKWNPYASLSLGTNISTKPFQKEFKGVAYKDSGHMYMGDLTIGANYQVSDKLAIYFGVSGGVAFKSSYYSIAKRAIFEGLAVNIATQVEKGTLDTSKITWSSTEAVITNHIALSRINLKATVGFAF